MNKPKNDELFDRIMSESRGYKRTLDEIQKILDSSPKFQGMTLTGGVKAILKAFNDEQERSFKLTKELESIKSK